MVVKVHVNLGDIAGKVNRANKFAQYALDEQVLGDSNKYVPYREGDLMKSSIIQSSPGYSQIVWDTEYARRMYYHPEYNFDQTTHPQAGGLWFERAKADRGDKWVSVARDGVNQYLNEHRT
ncbi:minor capsid protein [Sporolactobacillus laevolacticus]|uniref:Minor capsid protein n=1 Tax=Sporolactobacillus laevolacticus DSM 442 TaxID=1395513 RepID=V6IVC8_9BACL|nr:minor capsid protein [Sporolactobacillus laevolacticus]EST11102.1 hypothetical protein P343_12640 [Sporolactobacillus laevolacticus DSM 442]